MFFFSLSLIYHIQTDSGANPASSLIDTGGSFLGDIVLGCEAEYSPPLVPGLRMSGAVPPLPRTFSWHGD
jgi:hypothetical protein